MEYVEELGRIRRKIECLWAIFPASVDIVGGSPAQKVVSWAQHQVISRLERRLLEGELTQLLERVRECGRRIINPGTGQWQLFGYHLLEMLTIRLVEARHGKAIREIEETLKSFPPWILPNSEQVVRMLPRLLETLDRDSVGAVYCGVALALIHRILDRLCVEEGESATFRAVEKNKPEQIFTAVHSTRMYSVVLKCLQKFPHNIEIQHYGSGIIAFLPNKPTTSLFEAINFLMHLLSTAASKRMNSKRYFCMAAACSLLKTMQRCNVGPIENSTRFKMFQACVMVIKKSLNSKATVYYTVQVMKLVGDVFEHSTPNTRADGFGAFVGAMRVNEKSWRIQTKGWESFATVFGRQAAIEQQHNCNSLVALWKSVLERHGNKRPCVVANVFYALGTFVCTPQSRLHCLKTDNFCQRYIIDTMLHKFSNHELVLENACFALWNIIGVSANPNEPRLQPQPFFDPQRHGENEEYIRTTKLWKEVLGGVLHAVHRIKAKSHAFHCLVVAVQNYSERLHYLGERLCNQMIAIPQTNLNDEGEGFSLQLLKRSQGLKYWSCAMIKTICGTGSSDALRTMCVKANCVDVCMDTLDSVSQRDCKAIPESVIALERLFRCKAARANLCSLGNAHMMQQILRKVTNGVLLSIQSSSQAELVHECIDSYCKLVHMFAVSIVEEMGSLFDKGAWQRHALACFATTGVICTVLSLFRICNTPLDAVLLAMQSLANLQGLDQLLWGYGAAFRLQRLMGSRKMISASTAALSCRCLVALFKVRSFQSKMISANIAKQVQGVINMHINSEYVIYEAIQSLRSLVLVNVNLFMNGSEYATMLDVLKHKSHWRSRKIQMLGADFLACLIHHDNRLVKRLASRNVFFIVLRALNLHIKDPGVVRKHLQCLSALLRYEHTNANVMKRARTKSDLRAVILGYKLSRPTLSSKIFTKFKGVQLVVKVLKRYYGAVGREEIVFLAFKCLKHVLLFEDSCKEKTTIESFATRSLKDPMYNNIGKWKTKIRFEAFCIHAHIALHNDEDKARFFPMGENAPNEKWEGKELQAVYSLYPFLDSSRPANGRHQCTDLDNMRKRAALLRYTLDYYRQDPAAD